MQEAPPEPTRIDLAKRKLLRIGSAILGFGVLIALTAAVIGGTNPRINVELIRSAGGITMVAGLVTLLAGYRLAWIQESWSRHTRSGPARWVRQLPALSRFFFTVLPIVIGSLAVLWTTLFLMPSVLAGVAILALTFLIPVVLVAVVAHGRGYQKTFCLGALIPSCAYMLVMTLALAGATFGISSRRGLVRAMDEIGEGFVATGLVWVFSLIAGLTAVGVRVLLERLQPPERRWRE